ncbi:MAG: diaminopimelate decarboxylase [Nocardioidaceae bacterium]
MSNASAPEAGTVGGPAAGRGPAWLLPPDDVNALVPGLWSRTAGKDANGRLVIGGVGVDELAAEHGTPVYVLDEADLRSRAGEFREAFAGVDVYYAGKAFLCGAVAQWVHDEGLSLDVCSGGELALALASGMPAKRVAFHGNNKSDDELAAAVHAGVGKLVIDSFEEIARLAELVRVSGRDCSVLVRVTPGVEAHTHEFMATAHEDQKFGLSIAEGHALEAVRRVVAVPGLRLRGLHSHIGSQIFGTAGFEVAIRRVLALHARIRHELHLSLPELGLGGGFGIAYTTRDTPSTPQALADGLLGIVRRECAALDLAVPRLSIEPGRAVVGPAMCTLYRVGTTKQVPLSGGAVRSYVSVDGGMSDNPRTALYGAAHSCTLASRRSSADASLTRVVGKHCESGDIVVRDEFLPGDVRPGDLLAVPGTGAYCRSMASNYNHVPRPAVVAVRDGRAEVVVRAERVEDLMRLDVVAGRGSQWGQG